MRATRPLLLVLPLLLSQCGKESDVDTSSLAALPTCDTGPAADVALRAQGAAEVATGACGEVALLSASSELQLVPVATGVAETVLPSARGMAFTSRGDRLLAIDETGTKVTVIDTRTRARREITIPAGDGPVGAFGVLRAHEIDDAFYTCANSTLRVFTTADGALLSSHGVQGCGGDLLAGPRGSAVARVYVDVDAPVLEIVRADGASKTIGLLDWVGDATHHSVAYGDVWNGGRFISAYGELREMSGDSDQATSHMLTVVDTATLETVFRGSSGSVLGKFSQGSPDVLHVDSGTFLSQDRKLLFLSIRGTTRDLGAFAHVIDAWDTPTGAVVIVERTDDGEATLVSAETGETLATLGKLGTSAHADGGAVLAYGATLKCIQYRTQPGTCHGSPTQLRVRTNGVERVVGWSYTTGRFIWAGADGSVIFDGDIRDGDPPAISDPDDLPAGVYGTFLIAPDGTRTEISAHIDEIDDVRGAPLVRDNPDSSTPGWGFSRLVGASVENLARLDDPTVYPSYRSHFAVLVDRKSGTGAVRDTYDVWAGNVR